MILISDIGNTNITVGLYDNDKKIITWRLTTDPNRTSDEYGIILSGLIFNYNRKLKLEGAIVSSVVTELTDKYICAIKKYLNIEPINFSYKTKIDLKVVADNISEVGADRLVDAIAAKTLYQTPAIVVDMGTATTFDVIDEKGVYIGGIIAAGMKIQAKALHKYTSKLPLLDIEKSEKVIGQNTQDAIMAGIVRGHAKMIEGLLADCSKYLKQRPTIIATGGYSNFISEYMNIPFDIVDEDLTLKGLNIIYNKLTK